MDVLPIIVTSWPIEVLPPIIALLETVRPVFADNANKGPPIFAWPALVNPNIVFEK